MMDMLLSPPTSHEPVMIVLDKAFFTMLWHGLHVPGPVLIVLDKAYLTMLWHGSPWGPSSAGSTDSATSGNTLTAQPQPRAELDSTLNSMPSDPRAPTRAHDPRKNSSSFRLKDLLLGMAVLIHLQGCAQLCAIYLNI